ncbi:DUF4844 domain-containing protein [Massilia sp. CMS3.1]|uniref:DUF4844 domain-containing protein n=1 Tax=Massilia sp. CMS3.1 TaxID=3373083 RepID=UPI003EE7A128
MVDNPLSYVVDAPLFIVARVLASLRAYRAHCPTRELEQLVDTLLAGIEAHPTKFWVMKQFQKTLEQVADEDAAVRELIGGELEKLMDMLGIDSSDGVLGLHRR